MREQMLIHPVAMSTIPEGIFVELVVANHVPHVRHMRWPSAAVTLDPPAELEIVVSGLRGGSDSIVARLEEGFVYAALEERQADVWFAVTDLEAVPRLRTVVEAFLPPESDDPEYAKFIFWSLDVHLRAHSNTRRLHVPSWNSVAQNYPSNVRTELDKLAKATTFNRGRLIVWHGPPGGGKTYALRALAAEWHSWCQFEYVTDPESFFGSARYMLQILLEDGLASQGWRAIVLEDSGEYIAADAKHGTGQGLSRLLNLVDGLIGQGLNILLILTTNEDIATFHPAVTRPGRCVTQVEFRPFSPEEAQQWLGSHDVEVASRGSMLLSDLFALKDGERSRARPRYGFTR